MTKAEFKERIREAGLTAKEFAQKSGTNYSTVNNWNDRDRPIPAWVDSWVSNYVKAQNMDRVAEAVQPYVGGKMEER